ncbi:hypothetical protein N7465_000388 [Penicillium sp. CMV-2018d]|nr:hypothetical protein N7465_000388 [Penicillium sp. CMV-2018d]
MSRVQLSDEFKDRVRTAFQDDPRWSSVLTELQRIAQDPNPVKPRLSYETDDGLLYSLQAEGEYWRCIPSAIKEEIPEVDHGQ